MIIESIKAAIRSHLQNVIDRTGRTLTNEEVKATQVPSPIPRPGRRLHIGGYIVDRHWEIIDTQSRIGVDHVGDASDLSRFKNETFSAVYASHVLEHFECIRVVDVLSEWRRVLVPGGLLYISVPNLDVLSAILIDKQNSTLQQRFDVIRMLFGGQVDTWDFHKVGLNEEVLFYFLNQAGFSSIQRVNDFGFFPDTSTLIFLQRQVSLNVVAYNP